MAETKKKPATNVKQSKRKPLEERNLTTKRIRDDDEDKGITILKRPSVKKK